MSTFADFNLPQPLLQALTRMKYEAPTPIQEKAIPFILEGKDVIASAQTGTGKTAAFGVPLITALLKSTKPRALVLAPTRELADQILAVIRQLTATSPHLTSTLLIGGASLFRQARELDRYPRILVATPGRLVDHLRQDKDLLSQTEYLVLDEADRMLDMGFAPQLEIIRRGLPTERQTLMFSATFPTDIASLATRWLRNPERVSVGEVSKPIEQVTQSMIEVTNDGKRSALIKELKEREGSVLVFVRTKHRTDSVAKFLHQEGHSVTRIHGGRSQGQRQDAIAGFRKGKFRVLVATDIAARGLDVPHIEHVINYDLPQVADDYLHRIGRTARAGRSGNSLCFVSTEEKLLWFAIQKLLKSKDGLHSSEGDRFGGSSRPRFSSPRGGSGRRSFGGGGGGRGGRSNRFRGRGSSRSSSFSSRSF